MKDENNFRKASKDPDESPYTEEEDRDDEEEEESEEQDANSKQHHKEIRLLTYIQIFGCIAILAAALAIRMFNTDLYSTVRVWYVTAVNNSIIADEQMDQAKRTIIGLWNNISSAGPQLPASSSVTSSQTQSSQASTSSNVSASSQSAQNSKPVSSDSAKKPDNNQQVSP